MAITGILAIALGVVDGFVVSRLGRKQNPYDDGDEFFTSEVNEDTTK